jgi:hypothetical protein
MISLPESMPAPQMMLIFTVSELRFMSKKRSMAPKGESQTAQKGVVELLGAELSRIHSRQKQPLVVTAFHGCYSQSRIMQIAAYHPEEKKVLTRLHT